MELKPVSQRFVLHWGEMGSKWGVNRTVAQIHALIYLSERPLPADEIAETLGVARSNVSNSLKELQGMRLIRTVHLIGDRRDHFDTSKDIWALFRAVVSERKGREFDPTVTVLRECMESPELKEESKEVRERIAQTLQLMETLGAWGDEMLRLPPETLVKVMKLGAKIQKLVRGGKDAGMGGEK